VPFEIFENVFSAEILTQDGRVGNISQLFYSAPEKRYRLWPSRFSRIVGRSTRLETAVL
jgi:hypothetical protein